MSDKVQEERKVKKTEVLKWSKDDILRFLAVYKKYEELWDTSNENFMRKNVREHNFTRLYRELIGMGFNIRTEEQMKRKIKNLKDAFRNEVNKVKKSKKSGAIADNVYTPKLAWFQEADSFLSNVMSCRESIANVGQSMTTENLIEEDDNDLIDKNEDKNNPNEENDQTSELQNDTLHAASVISQEKVIIKRKHSPMMAKETLKNNLTNKVKKNSSSFQNAVSQLHEITQMTTEINDEYECFAKYITSQLKQLPLRSFLVLQEKIQSLITQERLASIG